MKISFLEEYPTDENLSKLKLIPFKINLYVASESARNFSDIKKKINREYKNVEEVVYWPILKVNEGYWMSAFSKYSALKRVIKEINSNKEYFSVLWDAELPLLYKKLYVSGFFNFFRNRSLIKKILKNPNKNHPIIVAVFPKSGISKFLHYLAMASFYSGKFSYMDMIYTSLLTNINKREFLKQVIEGSRSKFKNYIVSLGLIAGGVEGNTVRLISKENLSKELQLVEKLRIKEVVIYRLAGINEDYLSVVKRFVSESH